MDRNQPPSGTRWIMATTAILVLMALGGAGPAWAGSWVKAAGGVSGMAMDDINNADFRFYDNTINGYDFPDLDSGFSLSFHVGYDMSTDFSLGFSWDNQYARVKGTDDDVTADLNLDANFFMTHLYWRGIETGSWEFGAAGGVGLVFSDGKVKLTGDNNVNYGEGETSSSSSWAFELMGLVDYRLGRSTILETTIGWRVAVIDEFKYAGAPALKEDGTNLELDYTGYIVKVGIKYYLGGG